MEKEVDVITLCKRLVELTKQEKCSWKETSENNRFKLSLNNGAIEIYHFVPEPLNIMVSEYYEVALFDKSHTRYATYKGSGQSDYLKTFSTLYYEVRELLEKMRRRKMALLLEELEASDDKK